MNDLISKRAAIEAVLGSFNAIKAIEQLHTVDAVPVMHGRWPPSNEYKGFVECSECHNAFVYTEWILSGKWSFCPNCGAKMENVNEY